MNELRRDIEILYKGGIISGVVDAVDDERVNNFLFRLLRFKRMNTVKPMIKTSKIPPSIPATIELVFDVLLI